MPSAASVSRKLRVGVVVGVLLVGVAGCRRSGQNSGANPTVPTAPQKTTTTVPADPYAIPAKIDIAYVQRVFDALDQIDGEVFKEFLANRQLTPAMGERIATIYNPPLLELEVKGLIDQLERGFDAFKESPGIRRRRVMGLISARPNCIFAKVAFDGSEVLKEPKVLPPIYLGLQPTEASSDPANFNPTPFSVFFEDQKGEDPCSGR